MKTKFNIAASIFLIALLTFSFGTSLTWSNNAIGYSVAPALEAATPPTLEWNATFGLGYYNTAHQIIRTIDGGYAITGMYGSANPLNATLVKYDANGNLLWYKSYDLQFINHPLNTALIQTNDSGFALLGNVYQSLTLTLIKTEPDGKIQWSQTYSGNYLACGMTQTKDGGYLITGTTSMLSIETHRSPVLIKTDSSGKTQWSSITIGDRAIVQADDGNYVVAAGDQIVKVDASGNILWNRELPPVLPSDPQQYRYSVNDIYAMTKTADGGYALAGHTINENNSREQTSAAVLIKTDSAGFIQWNKTYGADWQTWIFSIIQTSDNGYALAGMRHTVANCNLTDFSQTDMVLIKTDPSGNEQWTQTFGASQSTDIAVSVVETDEGGFALAGQTKPGTRFSESYFYIVKTTSLSPTITPAISSSTGIPTLSLEILVIIAAILAAVICTIILAIAKMKQKHSSKQQF